MKKLFLLFTLAFVAMSCEMIDEKLDDFLGRDDSSVTTIPNNQIWYTSTDGEIVEPYSGVENNYADALTTFGVNIVSNTYVDGKGVIEFDGDVTTIGEDAFYWCYSLTSITIGDSVTTIGENAFRGCSSLQEVNGKFASEDGRCLIIDGVLNSFAPAGLTEYTIPDSVTTIGDNAFNSCLSLTSVTIPDSVTTIGNYAFEYCSCLTNVTIPDSVTTIGDHAFCRCTNLTSVTIPDGVTTIGDVAFYECSSLTSVTIPDSVATIGVGAFSGCSSLQEFNGKFASEDGRYLIIDGVLNSFAPAGLTEYTIPDRVTTIGNSAFYNCSSLTSVNIPDSVTTIGEGAFFSCSSITSVYCKPTTPPAGSWSMFFNNASGRKIYVPMESVEAYKSAQGWSEYASAIEGYNF